MSKRQWLLTLLVVSQRCGQPGQQQGLRFPSLRLEQPHSIRRVLVSAFLANSIQQIHSLRARGVMSSHVSKAFASEVSAIFRSAGRSWTTPPEISFALRASLISVSPEVCDGRKGGVRTLRTPLIGLSLVMRHRGRSTRCACSRQRQTLRGWRARGPFTEE